MSLLRRSLVPCLLIAVSLCFAARVEARPDRVVTPITVSAEKTESLTFANLVLRAKEVDGIMLAGDQFRIEILEELRRHGYKALGAENLVFGQDDSEEARFVLGGTIREVTCVGRRHCSVGVEWELLDRQSKKVVYKVMARAGERDVDLRKGEQVAKDMLRGALRSLLARQRFVDALTIKESAPSEATGLTTAKFLPCTSPELVLPGQVESAMTATVVLENDTGHGSGVIVSPDGLVLTAAHVAQVPGLRARLRDGSVLPFKVVRMDLRHDVAVGRIEGAVPGCLALRATPATVGEDVFAIGAPADKELAFSLTRGIVSGMREHQGAQFLQTDASVNPGNSGGPLLDKSGRVMAIVSWKVMGTGVEGLAFGVPVGHALTRLALEASSQTDETLIAAAVTKPEPASVAVPVEDTADPQVSFAPPPRQPRGPRPPGWARALRWGGLATAGLGVSMALVSWASVDDDSMKHGDYMRLRRINDVGWAFTGLGVASMACSWILPSALKKSDKPKTSAPAKAAGTPAVEPKAPAVTTQARIGVGSVSLEVRF
jgi:serine protease Do